MSWYKDINLKVACQRGSCICLLSGPYDDAIADKFRERWDTLSHSSVPSVLCFYSSSRRYSCTFLVFDLIPFELMCYDFCLFWTKLYRTFCMLPILLLRRHQAVKVYWWFAGSLLSWWSIRMGIGNFWAEEAIGVCQVKGYFC